jgi:hypothetical protein
MFYNVRLPGSSRFFNGNAYEISHFNDIFHYLADSMSSDTSDPLLQLIQCVEHVFDSLLAHLLIGVTSERCVSKSFTLRPAVGFGTDFFTPGNLLSILSYLLGYLLLQGLLVVGLPVQVSGYS